jgi:hypothetical protein
MPLDASRATALRVTLVTVPEETVVAKTVARL